MGPEVPAFKGSYAGSTGFAAHDRAAPAAQVEAGAAEEDGSDHGSIGADPADLQMQQVRHGVLKYALYMSCYPACACVPWQRSSHQHYYFQSQRSAECVR